MDKNQSKKNVMSYLHDLAMLLAVVLLLFFFVFRIVTVSGPSMLSTLYNGDHLIVLTQPFMGEVEAGDIIIISKADYDNGTPIVKRVIATAGQTVEIKNTRVYVDGRMLNEAYIDGQPTHGPSGDYYRVTVADGCVFVLGDNRIVSKDSRSSQIGQIDCRQIVGKALFRIWPGRDGIGNLDFSRIGGIY